MNTTLIATKAPLVGDGATIYLFTDRVACTVTKVSPSGKTVTIQEDTSILDSSFKPNMIPGGFAGHTMNNHAQTYSYDPNPKGKVWVARLHKNGCYHCALGRVRFGVRSHFYDYNF